MSSGSRVLMLVSERADARLREEVRLGSRPCPEYLRLEEHYGVALFDWSQLGDKARERSGRLSLAHAGAALRRLDHYDSVLSDGEHVGMPLAMARRALRRSWTHVMIGHHLTSGLKPSLFRAFKPDRGITRLLLHSHRQLALAHRDLGIPADKLRFQPYGVDHAFWSPRPGMEESLIVSAGREHRDYATLAGAVDGLSTRVFLAAGSIHSPSAKHAASQAWPANVRTGLATRPELRDWYARAAVVVVPLIPNDFQAGVTTLLEAMSMAKAVVVTATDGQRDIVRDGVTAVTVPPRNASALRTAITRLLASPGERARIGFNARAAVEQDFNVDAYGTSLYRHLEAAMGVQLGSRSLRDEMGLTSAGSRPKPKESPPER